MTRLRPWLPSLLWLTSLLALALLPGCTLMLDAEQVRLCRQTLPAINAEGAQILVTGVGAGPGRYGVQIDYTATQAGVERRRRALCDFSRDGVGAGRQLLAFATEDETYSPIRLHMLQRFWLQAGDRAVQADPGPGASETPGLAVSRHAAIVVQAVLDALPRTSLTMLVAAAYGLVYGLVGRINLAFAAITTLGAAGAGLGMAALGPAFAGLPVLVLVILIAAGALLAGIYGFALHRLVFFRLAFRSDQAWLVATLAVAIALAEFLLVAQGPHLVALPQLMSGRFAIAGGGGFVATISAMGVAITLTAAAFLLALVGVIRLTGFGRSWRAVADDARMAALLGVAPGRMLAVSLTLASALAGAAGALAAVQVGEVDVAGAGRFALAPLLAAVIGGIGSVERAMLGGLLIGLMETLGATLLPSGSRDAAVLAAAVLLLVLRPEGLLGGPARR